LHTIIPICLRTKAANAPAETGVGEVGVEAGAKKLWNLKLKLKYLMKTAKNILGVAVALAITVSGSFAATVINTLPFLISAPGEYTLAPNAVAKTTTAVAGDAANPPSPQDPSTGIYGLYAIRITSSGVTLNLNDQTITCAPGTSGIIVTNAGGSDPAVQNVQIMNGTVNGAPLGIMVIGNVWYTTVHDMVFAGNNIDNSYSSSFNTCTFQGQLQVYADHSSYQNLSFAGIAGQPVLLNLGSSTSTFSSYKNITIVGGNVQINGANDIWNKNFFGKLPTTVFIDGVQIPLK
jgi:hypothetical protein